MKRLTLFPKTFLASISMLATVIVLAHGLIFFLMPMVYLQQKQQVAEESLTVLCQQLQGKSAEEMRHTARDFALQHNVNITLTIGGRDEYFQGFQAVNIITEQPVDTSLVQVAGEHIDPASIIIKTAEVPGQTGTAGVKLLVDVEPVKQAKAATVKILPYTMAMSLLVALIFSYWYSRFITRPIRRMAQVTTAMQRLQPGARYAIKGHDEIAILGANVNQLYDNLRRTIQLLERENAQITRLEKEKLAFLRSASHELKTPLAALRIMLENIQLGVTPPEEQRQKLAETLAMVDRLSDMVAGTLQASQSADQALAHQKMLRVDQLARRVIDEYRLLAAERHITFVLKLTPLKVHANPDILQHVLSNLISNAVRYSDSSSTITVRIHHGKLSISNTCRPLTAEECQQVFEPFYRAQDTRAPRDRSTPDKHAPRSDDTFGNGIGLYMVKLLLDARGWPYQFVPTKNGMRFAIDMSMRGRAAAPNNHRPHIDKS